MAIENVPDAREIEQTAIRLYFTAWEHVTDIIIPLLESHSGSIQLIDRTLTPTKDEMDFDGSIISVITEAEAEAVLKQYIARAQPDLHLCYALIQQSQEIALKARICAVSPFLLLLGSEVKSWAKPNGDFTDFRTLDAVDLIRVVNAVCSKPVSEQFATKFDIIRRGRNKIQHLGSFKDAIDPIAALDVLVEQWLELFPDRSWLQEFKGIIIDHHISTIVDDSDFGEVWSMLGNIERANLMLTDRQRRRLFGISDKARLFDCFYCRHESKWDDRGNDSRIATLEPNGNIVHCHLCLENTKVSRIRCFDPECGCDVIYAEGDYEGECAVCGEPQPLASEASA
ncbi:hypothetical protein OKC48_04120 [Methylorubrum extorquens]|uniref:hypothetical protein n=1 Tax=Methylorubrum extorquens TaxID=408 RepID=UPI0022373924|nr:hypothetical protein [Methylorubrum extorquens]UYW27706.1 hypothetical protein OKC48_04120 [Methylorubrum extorquens]